MKGPIMRSISAWFLFSLLLAGCMEGPPGPTGPAGRDGFGAADSVVYDAMEPFLIWCKRDTGWAFSPAAQARYDKIDKSKYQFDSVVRSNGVKELTLLLKLKYDPQYWWGTQTNTGTYIRSDSDSGGWFLKHGDSYWPAKPSPFDEHGYPASGNYYPGKGLDMFYSKVYAYEGQAKIKYWK
jgi:hypothetical protein